MTWGCGSQIENDGQYCISICFKPCLKVMIKGFRPKVKKSYRSFTKRFMALKVQRLVWALITTHVLELQTESCEHSAGL